MALGMSAADGWPRRGRSSRESGYSSRESERERGYPSRDEDAEPAKTTIAIVRPREHEEVYAIGYEIGDYFRRDIPVIINLEDLTVENATRVVDFVSGTIFGRRGDIERLSNRVFLVVPPGSTVLKPAS
ncbi:cell division protein SepF [Actinoplanes sp. NPDC051411]|uniref:cell division protein SepF n=1 Tax=Actinoplanes sp. NPDC051411 TaxID=3155522 RepID=UPI00343C81FE